MKYIYLLPLYFIFKTRLNTFENLLGWILTYLFPIFIFFAISYNETTLIELIFSSLIIISTYEIGYFYNDIYTITKEKNPNLRINDQYLLRFYKDNKFIFILIRLFLLLLFFYIIENLLLTLVILINQLFFLIHNNFRSKLNIATFFLVNQTKNISFILISKYFILFDVFFLFILFFYRSIENSSRPIFFKNNIFLSYIYQNTHLFRLVYLLLMIVIFNFFYNLNPIHQFIMIYLLIIRFIFFFYFKIFK